VKQFCRNYIDKYRGETENRMGHDRRRDRQMYGRSRSAVHIKVIERVSIKDPSETPFPA